MSARFFIPAFLRVPLFFFALIIASRAADPAVGEWPTFGNGPSHSGFYPKTVGTTPFTLAWKKDYPTYISAVAVSADTVFTAASGSERRVFALNAADGAEKWSYPMPFATSLSAPTVANGRLFFQRLDYPYEIQLYSLDAATGALRFAQSNDVDVYFPPTVADGAAFLNYGSYGAASAFDTITGVRRYSARGYLDYRGTPSFSNGILYHCYEGVFGAANASTGALLWNLDLRKTSVGLPNYGFFGNSICAVAEGKAAIIGGARIVVVDLSTRQQLWSAPGNYEGTPAIAEGKVFAIARGEVKVHDAATGTLLGTCASGGFVSLQFQPIVTKDLILAATNSETFVFDRATFALRQMLPHGGSLAYATGRLHIAGNGHLATYVVTAADPDAPAPFPPPPPPPPTQANPARPLGLTTAAWIQSCKTATTTYFLFNSPAKLERYDTATGAWLDPISLPYAPTGFTVSPTAIYVSFDSQVSRFSLDGTTETSLATLPASINALFEIGDRLYLADKNGSYFFSIDPVLGTVLGTRAYFRPMRGVVAAPQLRRLFGQYTETTFADVLGITLTPDGSFDAQMTSPNNGEYDGAYRTYLFPSESRIVNEAGNIFATSDLAYLGNLHGAFDDIAFQAEAPVVLRGNNTLIGYSNGLSETGRKAIAAGQKIVSLGGGFAHAFARQDGRGIVATKVPLTDLLPADTDIDPATLAYTPDAVEFDGEIVYLLSKKHLSMFRWSFAEQRYLSTIPLSAVPKVITVSPTAHRLYVGYPDGRITQIDSAGVEAPFANLASAPSFLTWTDQFLVAVEGGAFLADYSVYSVAGQRVSTFRGDAPNYGKFVWNAPLRTLQFSNYSGRFASLSLSATGILSNPRASEYEPNIWIKGPIRVAPDGSIAIGINAEVRDANTLAHLTVLPVPAPVYVYPYDPDPHIFDAAWTGATLHTVRGSRQIGSDLTTSGMIESWASLSQVAGAVQTTGIPLQLLSAGDGLLLVSMVDGRPEFARYNTALQLLSSGPANPPPPADAVTRPNPPRALPPTSAPWIDSTRYSGITYFLFDTPAKIERYDTISGTWLEPISLPAAPRFLRVGSSGIYVSFGRTVSRFSLDGTTETPLVSTAITMRPMAEHNGLLYLVNEPEPATYGQPRYAIVDVLTGRPVSESTSFYRLGGFTFSPARTKFFGRTIGGSPSDLLSLALTSNGGFGTQSDSPYHGDYPDASRVFLSPDQNRVFDDAGIVYSAAGLTYEGSLAGAFDDLDFAADAPVLLRGKNTLVTYSPSLAETGRKTLAGSHEQLSVGGGFAHVFAIQQGRGVAVAKIALSAIVPSDPGPPVNPVGLAYTPDAIELGEDTIYLLSKTHRSIFRWSVSQSAYLGTIPLIDAPLTFAYSKALQRIYCTYASGRITKIDLAAGIAEQDFVNLAWPAASIQTVDDFLFIGGWEHFTFSADGQQLSHSDWNYDGETYTWSPANRRMFFGSIGVIPADLHYDAISEQGIITGFRDTIYHGDYPIDSVISVSVDGSVVLLANGELYNGNTMLRLGNLPVPPPPVSSLGAHSLADAAWLDQKLYTLRLTYPPGNAQPNGGRIERWNGALQQADRSAVLSGVPVRLFAFSGKLLVITIENNRPKFTFFTPNLGPAIPPVELDFQAFTGTFFASITSDVGASPPIGAMLKLSVSATGRASGTLQIGRKTIPFTVRFDAFGRASVHLTSTLGPLTLDLVLEMTPNGPALSGNLEGADWSIDFDGLRARERVDAGRHVFHLSDPSESAREDVPPLPGLGTMTVSAAGNVRVAAHLFIGGPMAHGSAVLEDGSVVIQLGSADKTAFLTGRITPANSSNSDWTGSLHWFQAASAKRARYSDEIDTLLDFTGTLHVYVAPTTRPGETPLEIYLEEGDLVTALILDARMLASGLVLPLNTWSYSIGYLDRSTGLFRGTFIHPETRRPAILRGVLNQKTDEVTGGFLGPIHAGRFTIPLSPVRN